MPSRNCTSIFSQSKLNLLTLFGSNPIDSLNMYEKEIESCIYPSLLSFSFTLFSFKLFFFFCLTGYFTSRKCQEWQRKRWAYSSLCSIQQQARASSEAGSSQLHFAARTPPPQPESSQSSPECCVSAPQLSWDIRLHLLSPAPGAEEQPSGAGPLPASAHYSHETVMKQTQTCPLWVHLHLFKMKTCHSKQ